jgi:hypothetical protein
MMKRLLVATLFMMATTSELASAQPGFDPSAAISAQKAAMTSLAFMDGTWRGTASTVLPSGEKHSLTQTERIGTFLDGSVRVIEGRGYNEDGTVGFNAFAIISWDPDKKTYNMRSYAMGRAGDFPLTATPDGFSWEIPAGPSTIRYTAVIKDGTWHEIGERITAGKEPVRFLEMNLQRVGDTDWPAGGTVGPK